MSETLFNIVPMSDRIAPAATLHVEVIADFVCPFSFLGKRRLDRALEAVQGPTQRSWYPFQMNPDMPPDGLPFEEYLQRRFRKRDHIDPLLEHLVVEGRFDGINFDFDRIRHVPSTLPAHQVMQAAERMGMDTTVLAERLMSSFFEQGLNIGERDVLIELAASVGLTPSQTRRAIGSDHARQSVMTRESQVRRSGFNAAPGFLLNRRLLVMGAQSPDHLVNAFDRAMFGEGTDALVSPALH